MFIGMMIFLSIVVIVGAVFLIDGTKAGKQYNRRYQTIPTYKDSLWTGLWTIAIALGISLIFIAGGISMANDQTSDLNETVQLKHDREILVTRTQTVEKVVVKELRKYPDIEKDILENITPEILFSYPELKSSKTIMQAAKELKDSQDEVYLLDQDLNEIYKTILDRENSINFRLPGTSSYQEYFGKVNPLLK